MFSFTPAERTIVIFLVITAVVGSCMVAVKKMNPDLAPELNLGEKGESQPDSALVLELEEATSKEEQKQIPLGKININTADASQLELLPKIGPSTAERILQYRRDFGNFATIHDITNVKGIGEKTFENIKEHLTVGDVALDTQSVILQPKVEPETASEPKTEPKKDFDIQPEIKIVNLNTATKEELMTLPGIGETYADRILAYRDTTGSFKDITELKNVKGIGEKKFEKLRDLITVE